MIDNIETLNLRIAKLNRYGIRVRKPLSSGYTIMWSNASQKWFIGIRVNQNTNYNLDCNVLIAYGTKKEIEAILPLLNDHPLFRNSYEGKVKA